MSRLKVLYGFHAVTARLRHDASTIAEVLYDQTRRDRRMQDFLHTAKEAGVRLIAPTKRAWASRIPSVTRVSSRVSRTSARAEPVRAARRHPGPALLLVLDGVTDPHNLGACLRVADSAGAHAVIAPRDRGRPERHRGQGGERGGYGAVHHGDEPRPCAARAEGRRRVDHRHVGRGIGDALRNQARRPVALVMGAEGEGMRRLTRDTCDEVMRHSDGRQRGKPERVGLQACACIRSRAPAREGLTQPVPRALRGLE